MATRSLRHADAVASTGTVGDRYENAQDERLIGLYKTGVRAPRQPVPGCRDLELATCSWVAWFDQTRLHSAVGHVRPSSTKPTTAVSTPPPAAAAAAAAAAAENPARH